MTCVDGTQSGLKSLPLQSHGFQLNGIPMGDAHQFSIAGIPKSPVRLAGLLHRGFRAGAGLVVDIEWWHATRSQGGHVVLEYPSSTRPTAVLE
jgi:hypothetical protein